SVIIRRGTLNSHVADGDARLSGSRAVNEIYTGLLQGLDRGKLRRGNSARLPICECSLKLRRQSLVVEASNHDQGGIVRTVVRFVELHHVITRDRVDRLLRVLPAVRMIAVEDLVKGDIRDGSRVRTLLPEADYLACLQAVKLSRRKCRIQNDVRVNVECGVEVLR